MSIVQSFTYAGKSVRTVMVNGEPWFVAKDVLNVMGSSTTVTALEAMVNEGLGKEFVSNQPLETAGGTQNALCLSEPALTFFVSRSRTEMGKAVNRWIHTEVLPAIRKNGFYSMGVPIPPAQPAPQRDTIQYIEAATALNAMPDSMLKLLLRDSLVDELELRRNQKALPGAKTQYTIVKIRAKELGYTLSQIGSGTELGRFVRQRVEPAAHDRIGLHKVYHYEINDDLDNAIHEYFESRQGI